MPYVNRRQSTAQQRRNTIISGVTSLLGAGNRGNQSNVSSDIKAANWRANSILLNNPGVRRVAPTGGSGGYSSSSGSSGGGGDAAAAAETKALNQLLAQYDQSIGQTQSAINRLRLQQKSGQSKITSSYENALNQLLLGKNQANKVYDTNKQQSATDFVGAKNTIGAQAGNTLSGIRRLLGSRGAGGGSAYNISAPGAVTRQATLARQGATDTFGRNQQALDTNWGNFMTGYQNELSGAKNQRDELLGGLSDQTNAKKGDLLQTLADLFGKRTKAKGGSYTEGASPYLRKANRYLDDAATYKFKPIQYKTRAYNAPDLTQYTSEAATPTYQGEAAANDYISPYFSALLGRREEELAGA